MKTNRTYTHRSAWRLLFACFFSAALLAGCGTGDLTAGVGSGGTGTFTASLTGAVKDGYLINAIVFLDKNHNYQLDSNEPYTVTDTSGVGALTFTSAELAAYPIVAVALKGVTVDSATMLPVVSTYVFSFPKEHLSTVSTNIISPLSSQLRELIETGTYTTVQQAMDALANQVGLPADVDLLAQSIAADNPSLAAAARSIAALMWMQTDRILTTGGATPAVDIERYRAMMKLIENNMTIVSRLNTPENLINLNNNITVVLDSMPEKVTAP